MLLLGPRTKLEHGQPEVCARARGTRAHTARSTAGTTHRRGSPARAVLERCRDAITDIVDCLPLRFRSAAGACRQSATQAGNPGERCIPPDDPVCLAGPG